MGEKEKETKVKRFASIEEDTMKVVETLMLKGAEVAFEVTEGGHNSPVLPRNEKSVVSLFGNQLYNFSNFGLYFRQSSPFPHSRYP